MPANTSANRQIAGSATLRTPNRSISTPVNGIASAPVMCETTTAAASVARGQPNSWVIGPTRTPNGNRIIGPLHTVSASTEPKTTSQGRAAAIGASSSADGATLRPGNMAWSYHPASSFFTMALALPKSICPEKRSLSAAMVRPMSLRVAASSSLMSDEIASPASISDNCCGR